MKLIRLQYTGQKIFRSADESLNASLTVEPGDFVQVSEKKAAELLSGKAENLCGAKYWKRPEVDEGDVPPNAGPGASGPGTAMSSANTPTK